MSSPARAARDVSFQDFRRAKILEKATDDKVKVSGTIFGRVKGGFSVDLEGAIAFLPGS